MQAPNQLQNRDLIGSPLLQVRDLSICAVLDPASPRPIVDQVSFSVRHGEVLALMGQSGSGKTVTALSILDLLRPPLQVTSGSVCFDGQDLRGLRAEPLRRVRGRRIALVFQEPGAALNPLLTIGAQVTEGMREHLGYGRKVAWDRGGELLERLHVPNAVDCMRLYPHQLSGGMRQRVLIAVALACEPQLLIADEPTTALDSLTRREVIQLLSELVLEQGLSLLIVTHDAAVVRGLAQRVMVMLEGRVVEEGAVDKLFRSPAHPYTRYLVLASEKSSDGAGVSTFAEACPWVGRCEREKKICRSQVPPVRQLAPDHSVRCWEP